ncbi:hypothetical protein ACFSCX_10940 [Bacillus salitolerans]|uniref:Uncharacterized protein n=1 Tax=Bacillus salitolerans TaxID=1437434 RepID=A0ABW4LRC6_9BACI
MVDIDRKHLKPNSYIYPLVVTVVIFFLFHWDNSKNELNEIQDLHSRLITSQLKEISSVLFSVEETLNQYDYPISDNTRSYFQDALSKDKDRLNHITTTISRINQYPTFNSLNERYLDELKNSVHELSGFQYTEAEINYAIHGISIAQAELYTILDSSFDVEMKQHRDEYLQILNQLNQHLSLLKK